MRFVKYLFLAAIIFPIIAYSEKPSTFVFVTPKASCSFIDGKLVLSRVWPFGSWEDCAYAVLSAAQQLDSQKDALAKQLAEERAKPPPVCPACLGPVLRK